MHTPSLPFQAGSHASYTGALAAAPKAMSQQAEIYAAIRRNRGVTQALLLHLTGYPINVVSARVRALVLEGLVRADGFVRGPSGAQRTRWRVSTREEREDHARQQAQLEIEA